MTPMLNTCEPETSSVALEICVDAAEDLAKVVQAGPDRIELCAQLEAGGTTPSFAQIDAALSCNPQELRLFISPIMGDYRLDPAALQQSVDQIEQIQARYTDHAIPIGYVIGAVMGADPVTIDIEAATAWRTATAGRPLTFHRAFDLVSDQKLALKTLIELGYDAILTTGGHETMAQTEALAELIDLAAGKIKIIVSGGVRDHNVMDIIGATGASEVHMRLPGPKARTTDSAKVREVARMLRAGSS